MLFDRMMHAQIRDPTATEWQVADPSIDSPERGEFEGRFRHETKKWAQTLNSHALAERMSLTPVRARPFRVHAASIKGSAANVCAARVGLPTDAAIRRRRRGAALPRAAARDAAHRRQIHAYAPQLGSAVSSQLSVACVCWLSVHCHMPRGLGRVVLGGQPSAILSDTRQGQGATQRSLGAALLGQ